MQIGAPPSRNGIITDPVRPGLRTITAYGPKGSSGKPSPVLSPQQLRVPPSYLRSGAHMKLNGILETFGFHPIDPSMPTHPSVKDTVGTKNPPTNKDPNRNSAPTPFTPDPVTSALLSPSGGGQSTQTGQPFTLPDNVSYDVAPQIPPWMIIGGLGLAALLFFMETKD